MLDKKGAVPLYQQLAELLKVKTQSGELAPGVLMPSENKLAKEYSVSRMTARATLKLLEEEGVLTCSGTKGRIVANSVSAPQAVTVQKDIVIGVYPFRTYHYDDAYFGKILDGVSAGALNNHVKLKFLLKETVLSESASLKEHLHKEQINAILSINSNDFKLNEIKELEQIGFPVIAVNTDLTGSGVNFITCDHYQGTSLLMDSLCHMGHQKIACMLNPKRSHAANDIQYKAYTDAHERYKLDFNSAYTIQLEDVVVGSIDSQQFNEKMEMIFQREDRPSAIFISQGRFAEMTIEKLRKMHLPVPDDVSVVCFDQMSLPAHLPRVTCVKQPIEQMSEMAVDILTKKVRHPNSDSVEIKLAPELIPGNSCAFYKGR